MPSQQHYTWHTVGRDLRQITVRSHHARNTLLTTGHLDLQPPGGVELGGGQRGAVCCFKVSHVLPRLERKKKDSGHGGGIDNERCGREMNKKCTTLYILGSSTNVSRPLKASHSRTYPGTQSISCNWWQCCCLLNDFNKLSAAKYITAVNQRAQVSRLLWRQL